MAGSAINGVAISVGVTTVLRSVVVLLSVGVA